MIRVMPKMDLGVEEMGLIFCGKHPLHVMLCRCIW